ncbi:transaldolase [Candidatus Woesearchaeota archaeon]|nr:transaldolase [Candidatus Woesearchaeota archaeon]|tara:strand:+ start:4744 stop:5565 length:822 start_codon:yes stop_codon:yes gene_type:complete
MKIFIDTAKLEEIEEAYSLGILDGVTTNPSLIKKIVDELKEKGEKVDMESYITDILKAAKGTPVSLEVIGTSYEDMVKEGKKLFERFNPVADNVVIKIPVNPSTEDGSENVFDGIKAVKELSDAGIPVNCTLIFTPEQALMAAKAGAKFVSPFAGRVDDFIRANNKIEFEKTDYFPVEGIEKDGKVLDDNGVVSGIDLVSQCVEVLGNYGFETEVIAASIRNPRQAREAALAGAGIATLPFDVIKGLLAHSKTAEGMKKFVGDVIEEYNVLFK